MAIQPDYTAGTITLTSGSVDFTTTGAALQAAAIQAGDKILLPDKGLVLTIGSITGENAGTLTDECPAAAAGAGQGYRIEFQSDLSRVSAQTRALLDLLGAKGFFQYDAAGPLAERDDYDDRPQGFSFLDVSADPAKLYVKVSDASADWSGPLSYAVGPEGPEGQEGPEGDQGIQGHTGWTPVLQVEADGTDRDVLRIVDLTGGGGTEPSGIIGKYVGASGLVDTAAEALNIKGNVGPQGERGINWRGAWDSQAEYVSSDVVTDPDINDDPASWVAIGPSTNSKPRDNAGDWAFFPGSFPASADYGLITASTETTRDYGTIV